MRNPKYPIIQNGIPLSDPDNYNVSNNKWLSRPGSFIGLNRKNNQSSFGYAKDVDALGNKSRNYEHIGLVLPNFKLLHGSGNVNNVPNTGHYVIDELTDSRIGLPGYGNYVPVETIMSKKAMQIGGVVETIKDYYNAVASSFNRKSNTNYIPTYYNKNIALKDTVINLNDDKRIIKSVTGDNKVKGNIILGGEFLESKNKNTVRTSKQWQKTKDKFYSDQNLPVKNIKSFYGVENGKLKLGAAKDFNDNTVIVPNRYDDGR
jgi:hypothetical protein